MLLTGVFIDPCKLPDGWSATVECLGSGCWECRVYAVGGGCEYIDSMLSSRVEAEAIAHREAWSAYVDNLPL
jgi:hypothetical protein